MPSWIMIVVANPMMCIFIRDTREKKGEVMRRKRQKWG